MPYNNAVIRKVKPKTKEQRLHFVLEDDLRNELFDIAQSNYVSVSHFVRESVRRNINTYRKASSI
jgi:hypothetical protein